MWQIILFASTEKAKQQQSGKQRAGKRHGQKFEGKI
jgi:hypothetical protein